MKVLTIKQPYATLIAEGYKKYEFRSWKTKYRGEFLVHAGLGVDKVAMARYKYLGLDYPKGVIIAKCTLTDCIKVDDKFKEVLRKENENIYINTINSKDEEYAFKLSNVEKIENIPIKGKLSFWDYDYKD